MQSLLQKPANSKRLIEVLNGDSVMACHDWLLNIWPRLPRPIQMILQQMNPVVANVKMDGNKLGSAGVTMDPQAKKIFYTLLFNEEELEDKPDWFRRYIVVHELAHLASGRQLHSFIFDDANSQHYVGYDSGDSRQYTYDEQLADLLVYQWGFTDELAHLAEYENENMDLFHRKYVYRMIESMKEQLADWELIL